MFKLSAVFVQSLLWLQVAASPTVAGYIVGYLIAKGDSSHFAIPICTSIGFMLGGLWAEHIRKTVGLSAFLGRLIGMPEATGNDDNG